MYVHESRYIFPTTKKKLPVVQLYLSILNNFLSKKMLTTTQTKPLKLTQILQTDFNIGK